ncbi:MAG: ELWxxDGT repeat protein [Thermoanaerobaculia bacterium]
MSRRVLVLVLAGLLSGAALAQTPARVKDINVTQTGGTWQWPFSTQFVEMGGVLYFTSSDGIHGTELWRTDGTEAGTRMVKDICLGSCASWIFRLAVWGPALYFSADDGAHGSELWKSDGTEAGTVLVKDLTPGLAGSTPVDFFEAAGSLYFSAYQDATGRELWKSDGTEAGTSLAVDLRPGPETSYPRPLGRIGTTALLIASDGAHGLELWAFDGSPAGPALVKDINPGAGDSVYDNGTDLPGYRSFLVAGNRLYFVAQDGISGYELWVSDGTAAGTVLVKDINPGTDGSQPFSFAELNGQLLFRAYDADHGYELWRSDGTGSGTTLVKDIRPGAGISTPSELTVLGSWVYFRAYDDIHGSELWRSDGTEAGTTLVRDIRPGMESGLSPFGPAGFSIVGTTLTFFADDGTNGAEPWKSDGTEAGTTLLADLNPGAVSSMFYLYGPVTDLRTVWGGRWYFRAFNSEWVAEVYTSDGTPAGTQKLAEINTQTSAFELDFTGTLPGNNPMFDLNGILFFQATDGISGVELWKSDGTEAGTQQVADVVPGDGSSVPSEITPLGGSVLFDASSSSSYNELWISDGTAAGTSLVKDLDPSSSSGGGPQNLIPFGGQVFFSASSSNDNKLWKSDGTEAGTIPVRDLPLMALSPAQLTPAGNLLFFSGAGPDGYELWRTDGTAAGTVQIADIAPGSASSSPDGLTRVGSRVFFSADDGSSGRELWTSDGISTWRVRDILPGNGSSVIGSWGFIPEAWAVARGKLFFAADDGITGAELWMSDLHAGTVLLRDIFPGPRSSEIRWLTAAGELVYFVAEDGTHGRELWVSDGTVSGTRLLADLVPGEGSSLPGQLQEVGQNLVFSAHTPEHGREPWITDGDAAGTHRLADLAPGPLPSSPVGFTLSGPWLYFAATDAETGFELYSVPKESVDGGLSFYTVTPCRLVDTRTGPGPLSGGYNPTTFEAAGHCGIPETAQALAVNVTAVAASGSGQVLLFRGGTDLVTDASSLSFTPGRDRASNTTVRLGGGAFNVVVSPEFDLTVHLIVDVSGYFE